MAIQHTRTFGNIELIEKQAKQGRNSSSSSRSQAGNEPTNNHSIFKTILEIISQSEKPKRTQCPDDAISLAAMLASGASAYLFKFLKNIYITSHSNKMKEWLNQSHPSNTTCNNTLGDITDSGIIHPYNLNIPQNSSALLQSCEALQDSISTLNINSSLFQIAMIMSFAALAITILNRIATIKNRILINNTNEPKFSDEEKKLLKENNIIPDVASIGTSRIKANILLHSELSKHVCDNVTGIILNYSQPSLAMAMAIQEKSFKATTKSAEVLRISTAFLTKQSTPKMTLIHTACVGSFFAFPKFLKKVFEDADLITEAAEMWLHSLTPHNNKTCSDMYDKCHTVGLEINMPTIDQQCEKICQFTSVSDFWPSAGLILSSVVILSWLLIVPLNLPKGDPIPLNTILTESELTFLRGCNITENRLTPDVGKKIADLATSLKRSDEEVENNSGGAPLVGLSLP